jgi:hypothetical protein
MRAPRRQFASPFVVTVTSVAATVAAAAAGCGPSEPKCGRGCNPPGSFGPDERFVPDAAPAPDAEPPPLPEQDTAPVDPATTTFTLPTKDGPMSTVWKVYKYGNRCEIELQPQCRPMSTCNPPPPTFHPYPCPKGIAIERPLTIIQPPDSTECTLYPSTDECSSAATPCPPPRKVRCPGGSE